MARAFVALALLVAVAWAQLSFNLPYVLLGSDPIALISFNNDADFDLEFTPGLRAVLMMSPNGQERMAREIPPTVSNAGELGVMLFKEALKATLPSQLGLLSSLFLLRILDNKFLHGSIPSQLGQLTQLSNLEFIGNTGITGTIPSQLARLTQLQAVKFHFNDLHGSLPSQLGLLASVGSIELQGQQLDGTIPSQLGGLVHISGLFLQDNQFSGQLPSQLGNLGQLRALNIENNRIAGTLPTQLGLLGKLQALNIENNRIAGTLPTQLGLLFALKEFRAANNKLSGTIPSGPWFDNMAELFVSNNTALSGPIPAEVRRSAFRTAQFRFRAASTSLSGSISALFQIPQLEEVDIDHAGLHGPLPSQLSRTDRLTVLRAHDNQLSGTLPTELGILGWLTDGLAVLDVGSNRISGSLPSELGLTRHLVTLDVSDNLLTGSLPTELGLLRKLTSLALHANGLSGTLPNALVQLPALSFVSVSSNMFEGTVNASDSETVDTWLQACDNSGLDHRGCAYDCPLCGFPWTRVRDCDWRGRGSWCVRVEVLLAVAVVVALLCVRALREVQRASPALPEKDANKKGARQLGNNEGQAAEEGDGKEPALLEADLNFGEAGKKDKKKVTAGQFALRVALLLVVALEMALDFLFVVNSTGITFTLSLAFLVGGTTLSLGAGLYVSHKQGALGTARRVAAVCWLTLLDVNNLRVIVGPHNLTPHQHVALRLLSVGPALGEGILQATSVFGGQASTLNVLAMSVSLVGTLVQAVLVGLFVLARVHSDPERPQPQQQQQQPEHDNGKQGAGARGGDGPNALPPTSKVEAKAGSRDGKWGEEGEDGNTNGSGQKTRRRRLRWAALCCVCVVGLVTQHRSPLPSAQQSTQNVHNNKARAVKRWAAARDAAGAFSRWQDSLALDQGRVVEQVFPLDQPPSLKQAPGCDSFDPFEFKIGSNVVCAYGMVVVIHNFFGAVPMDQLSGWTSATILAIVSFSLYDPRLGTLTNLRIFSALFGEFAAPTELGLLTNLLVLDFEATKQVHGPEFATLTNLKMLYLDGPECVLGSEVGLLRDLELFLKASPGGQDRGTWFSPISVDEPDGLFTELGLLTNLRSLFYASHQSSPLPSQLGKLLRLRSIHATRAEGLPGELPSQLALLTTLESVTLGPGLPGTLPQSWFQNPALANVDLPNNHLGGELPTTIPNDSQLLHIHLTGNNLAGSIPSELGFATRLESLDLSHNAFDGSVPSQLGLLTALTLLQLSHNELGGTIPTELGLLTRLAELGLDSNRLDGPTPSQLGLLYQLQALELADNRLAGTLPTQLAGLSALTATTIATNQFGGTLDGMGAMWRQDCDFSGVSDGGCKRECPGCGVVGVSIRGCNRSGYGQVCLPLYAVVVIVVGVALPMRLILRGLRVRKARKQALLVGSALSSIAALQLILSGLFALNNESMIGTASKAILSFVLVGRLILTVNEVFRTRAVELVQTSKGSFGKLGLAISCCVVDPFMMGFLFSDRRRGTREGGSDNNRAIVRRRALVATLAANVPLMALTGVALATSTGGSAVAGQALIANVASTVAASRVLVPYRAIVAACLARLRGAPRKPQKADNDSASLGASESRVELYPVWNERNGKKDVAE